MTNRQTLRATGSLFILFALLSSVGAVSGNDDRIRELLKDNRIPALGLGVIRDGKLEQVKVFGELKPGVPAPRNTIFNVASLTKPVVAVLALKLVSAGRWSLYEPLDKYWVDPDLINDPRHKKLTTRVILSHRTGFANWRWLNESKKLEFAFEPGTKYQYSGEGLEYLRRAIEKKFDRPIEQLADELIFKPLGMSDTRFYWDAGLNESRFAVGYDAKGGAYKIYKNTKANAADDLLTTVEDYGKFLVAVMNGAGLSKDVFDEMVGHQVKRAENKYFGLGWEIYDLGNGEYALSHGGSDEGVKTLVFLFPKSKQGLIIFTNSDNGTHAYQPLINEYLKGLGRRLIDIEMKAR